MKRIGQLEFTNLHNLVSVFPTLKVGIDTLSLRNILISDDVRVDHNNDITVDKIQIKVTEHFGGEPAGKFITNLLQN